MGFNDACAIFPPKTIPVLGADAEVRAERARLLSLWNADNKTIAATLNRCLSPILTAQAHGAQRGFIQQRSFLADAVEADGEARILAVDPADDGGEPRLLRLWGCVPLGLPFLPREWFSRSQAASGLSQHYPRSLQRQLGLCDPRERDSPIVSHRERGAVRMPAVGLSLRHHYRVIDSPAREQAGGPRHGQSVRRRHPCALCEAAVDAIGLLHLCVFPKKGGWAGIQDEEMLLDTSCCAAERDS
jgi:hypothetical protein